MLAFINITLHITSPTHISSNTLELVISSKHAYVSLYTKQIMNLITNYVIVSFNINIIIRKQLKHMIYYRNIYIYIYISTFCKDLISSINQEFFKVGNLNSVLIRTYMYGLIYVTT